MGLRLINRKMKFTLAKSDVQMKKYFPDHTHNIINQYCEKYDKRYFFVNNTVEEDETEESGKTLTDKVATRV